MKPSRAWKRLSALTTLVVVGVACAAFAAPADAASPRDGHRLTAHQKKVERARLRKMLKHNPRVAARSWFIRKATLVDFDLTVTVRLGTALDATPTFSPSDDQIRFNLGGDPTVAPAPVGVLAGTPTSTLTGGFRASLKFGSDVTGYFLHPGVIELGFGAFELSGTGIDVVAGDPACSDAEPLLATDAITFAPSTTSASDGYLDMFTQRFSIDLATQPQFRSLRRPDCATALPLAPTNLMTGQGDPPVPLHIDGEFRVSPGFTADGYLRFGTLTAAGVQETPFAYLHTCTAAQSGPTNTCDGQADEVAYPMRTSTVTFTAEILLGKVPVSAS